MTSDVGSGPGLHKAQNVLHRVETWRTTNEPARRLHCAARECHPIARAVRQFDPLAGACESHRVIADDVTPTVFAGISVVINIAISLLLFPVLKHVGIAVATSVAAWANAVLLAVWLGRRGHFRLPADDWRRHALIVVASVAMAVVLWALAIPLGPYMQPHAPLIVQLVALGARTGTLWVGIVRLIRTAPGEAELAIAVADRWQGRGIGRRLLDAAGARAAGLGHRRLHAEVLAENRRALALLRAAFAVEAAMSESGVVSLELVVAAHGSAISRAAS